MKRFIRNVLLFLLPVIIALVMVIPVYFTAKATGEFDSTEAHIAMQKENRKALLGMGYNEQTMYYKMLNANERKTKVLALGTSRVMQFGEETFCESFYNCGGTVRGHFGSYTNFLQNLTYTPEVLIIGLDSWFFNSEWYTEHSDQGELYKIVPIERSLAGLMESIVKDRLANRWTPDLLNTYPDNIGFNGRVKDEGYQYDGSYYYGFAYRFPEKRADFGFAESFSKIQNSGVRFEWGDHIDMDAVESLEHVLSYCSENGIMVVAFLPPFASAVYQAIIESHHYGYLEEIMPACEPLFEKYGFEIYDYMDGAKLNVTDECFLDGSHGSDIVYAQILIDMANRGSVIAEYLDKENTEYLLETAYSNLVFEDPDNR